MRAHMHTHTCAHTHVHTIHLYIGLFQQTHIKSTEKVLNGSLQGSKKKAGEEVQQKPEKVGSAAALKVETANLEGICYS